MVNVDVQNSSILLILTYLSLSQIFDLLARDQKSEDQIKLSRLPSLQKIWWLNRKQANKKNPLKLQSTEKTERQAVEALV